MPIWIIWFALVINMISRKSFGIWLMEGEGDHFQADSQCMSATLPVMDSQRGPPSVGTPTIGTPKLYGSGSTGEGTPDTQVEKCYLFSFQMLPVLARKVSSIACLTWSHTLSRRVMILILWQISQDSTDLGDVSDDELSVSVNPEAPRELAEKHLIDQETIGDTVFSKHWLFSTLMKLIQVE